MSKLLRQQTLRFKLGPASHIEGRCVCQAGNIPAAVTLTHIFSLSRGWKVRVWSGNVQCNSIVCRQLVCLGQPICLLHEYMIMWHVSLQQQPLWNQCVRYTSVAGGVGLRAQVLRGNKDSVIAMLEAFVHDPLINWRLINPAETNTDTAAATTAANTNPVTPFPPPSPLLTSFDPEILERDRKGN